MADRTFFRDPETGRFISAERAAQLDRAIRVDFRGGFRRESEVGARFEEEPEDEPYESAFEIEDSKWGRRWDVRGSFDDVAREQMPEGATGYRVTYTKPPGVPGESGYRGQITGEWFGRDQWGDFRGQAPTSDVTGISFIVFDMGD